MELKKQTINEQNAIVYCVDNKRKYLEMLLNSIQGIRYFNKTVPIKILTPYTLTKKAKKLLSDPWIKVIKIPSIFKKFPTDKCIAGKVDIRNILLLDVDTFILGDIEPVFSISNADVSARLSYRYSQNWEEKYDCTWKANNAKLGIGKADIINSGVVIFRNNVHKKLFNVWVDIIRKFYNKEINEIYGGKWMFEQIALSMSIAKLNLKLNILDRKFHIFGWDDEEFNSKDAIVIHTNSSKYNELKNQLIKQKRI